MKIRFATVEDMDEILTLCKEHAEFEESHYSAEGKREAMNKALFSDPPQLYCLVAEQEGKISGYATYMKQFSTWDAAHYVYLDCLYLREEARGLRTGEKLMEEIKKESLKLGCGLMQWQTPDFNARAIKFYRRIGAYSKTKERFFLRTGKEKVNI